MIRYVTNGDIDRKRWDTCIAESYNGMIYACSWYLDILCPGQWDALIGDDYHSVFPLPYRKKAGISYIYTPFFIQQLGVFSQDQLTGAQVDHFLDAIPKSFRLIELNLNVQNVAASKGYSFVTNMNHELNLGQDYEQIRMNYSENLVRNLKKATNNAVSVNRDESIEPVIALFRAEKGREVKHWRNREYDLFRRLLNICKERGSLEVRGAYTGKGHFAAGIIFLRTDRRVIFLFSGTGEVARETGAMPWLIDNYIREYAGRNILLDFEGSNDEGLARFYKSFGAKQTTYQRAVRNKLPFWINFLRQLV
jgi:hypothetical protein